MVQRYERIIPCTEVNTEKGSPVSDWLPDFVHQAIYALATLNGEAILYSPSRPHATTGKTLVAEALAEEGGSPENLHKDVKNFVTSYKKLMNTKWSFSRVLTVMDVLIFVLTFCCLFAGVSTLVSKRNETGGFEWRLFAKAAVYSHLFTNVFRHTRGLVKMVRECLNNPHSDSHDFTKH